MKIGITENGDAGLDLSWYNKLVDLNVIKVRNFGKGVIPLLLDKKINNKIILHIMCSGFGGTDYEPNVPILEKTVEYVKELIEKGFPIEQMVLNIDPIILKPYLIKKLNTINTQSLTTLGTDYWEGLDDLSPEENVNINSNFTITNNSARIILNSLDNTGYSLASGYTSGNTTNQWITSASSSTYTYYNQDEYQFLFERKYLDVLNIFKPLGIKRVRYKFFLESDNPTGFLRFEDLKINLIHFNKNITVYIERQFEDYNKDNKPNYEFEYCGINSSYNSENKLGCISQKDVNVLGLKFPYIIKSDFKRNNGCLCPSYKIELLSKEKKRCENKCLHCKYND
jgi:hypothetical protein